MGSGETEEMGMVAREGKVTKGVQVGELEQMN